MQVTCTLIMNTYSDGVGYDITIIFPHALTVRADISSGGSILTLHTGTIRPVPHVPPTNRLGGLCCS